MVRETPRGGRKMNPIMTKSELDEHLQAHWDELGLYAKKYISVLALSIGAEDAVTGAYLHCLQCREEIEGPNEFIARSKHWIKMNLRWTQSPLRREHRGREHDEIGPWDRGHEGDPDWSGVGPLTQAWKAQLDLRSRRIWSLYWELDLQKGRPLAEHLNISISGAYLLLKEARELEQSYRQWILKHLN